MSIKVLIVELGGLLYCIPKNKHRSYSKNNNNKKGEEEEKSLHSLTILSEKKKIKGSDEGLVQYERNKR